MNTPIHVYFVESLLSRMVKAGWISGFSRFNATTFTLQWTVMGDQRLRCLHAVGAELSAATDERIPVSIVKLARGANPIEHPWVDWSKLPYEYTVLLLNQCFEELRIYEEGERIILLFRIAACWLEGGKSLVRI